MPGQRIIATPQFPDFSYEKIAQMRDLVPICGIDEAGRGPWAGPVVAAAVILDPQNIPVGIRDSKQLSPKKRKELFLEISASAIGIGIGSADVARIDRDNILQATMWAMSQAVTALAPQPTLALIDGNCPPILPCAIEMIIAGDRRSLSIAAASIIAKVTRDALMEDLDQIFPAYEFARHKGYGTKRHQQALLAHGPCPHHRMSFAPLRKLAIG